MPGQRTEPRTSLLATLALLAMTACWGSTFFSIKHLLDRVPVLDFLTVRFAVASVVLWLLFPRALRLLRRRSLRGVVVPDTARDWLSVVYMAVFAGAFALAGQTWAQAHLPPTRTAIIMSMEPVFAAFFAVLLGGESVAVRMLVGGSMVLAAMLVVELTPRRRVEAEVPNIAV